MRIPVPLLSLAVVAMLALSACDNAEDRAERHFQSAQTLVAAGDVDRALVELRNVFRLVGSHRDARHLFAELQLSRGETQDAYGNWLRLVEFHPQDLEARLMLAELALEARAFDEAVRHGRMAQQIAPEAPRVRAIAVALDYHAAILAEDRAARAAAAAEARAVLEVMPEALPARLVHVDELVATNALEEALRQLDAALAQAPLRRDLHDTRMRLLVRLGDDAGAGAQLAEMQARFPGDEMLREALVIWHLQRDRGDLAEAFLRDQVATAGSDPWPVLSLVEVIRIARGAEAARDEIARQLEAGGDPLLLRGARAELEAAEGRLPRAIAELEALVAEVPAGAGRRDAEVRLARLLVAAGDREAARARVAAVLEADESHVGALKLHARWMNEADRPGDAILALRRALTQEPRDVELMLLLSEAHLRDGSLDLAGERLALAVEVSNRAAEPALRYAGFLSAQGRLGPAEAVLEDALRVSPREPRLLVALGELRIARGDADRARRVIAALRALEDPQASRAADALQAALLARGAAPEATADFLRNLIARDGEEAPTDLAALALLLQTRIAAGDAEGAAAELDGLIAARPEDAALRLMRAGLHELAGETAEAEALYRALMAEVPEAEGPALALYLLLSGEGRAEDAATVLAAALEVQPGAPRLRWMRAAAHERAGETEAAIALYEALYAENGTDPVFANNLAALLSTARADAASLERAFAIARRLRNSEVPAFRDTYGWIEHRRGNHAEALRHLEFAAAGLPEVGVVQFHLGMVLKALERPDEARAVLARAVDLGLPEARAAEAAAALTTLGTPRPAAEPGQ